MAVKKVFLYTCLIGYTTRVANQLIYSRDVNGLRTRGERSSKESLPPYLDLLVRLGYTCYIDLVPSFFRGALA